MCTREAITIGSHVSPNTGKRQDKFQGRTSTLIMKHSNTRQQKRGLYLRQNVWTIWELSVLFCFCYFKSLTPTSRCQRDSILLTSPCLGEKEVNGWSLNRVLFFLSIFLLTSADGFLKFFHNIIALTFFVWGNKGEMIFIWFDSEGTEGQRDSMAFLGSGC